jgi:hypothetical protein
VHRENVDYRRPGARGDLIDPTTYRPRLASRLAFIVGPEPATRPTLAGRWADRAIIRHAANIVRNDLGHRRNEIAP